MMFFALLLATAALFSPERTGVTMAGRREAVWYKHDGLVSSRGPVDRFSVVKPVVERHEKVPLLVVLHWRGAGLPGKGVDMQTRVSDSKDAVFSAPDDFYILNLDDIRNYNRWLGRTHDDYWWGATSAYDGPVEDDVPRLFLKSTVCEERILATVEWVVQNYPIDRDRIYLCGNSMGGQAAMAIGLAHGDIFAAVNANVPATPWYAVARLALDRDDVARFPDPPVYIEWSGVDDDWSRDRDRAISPVRRRKWPHIILWGDFGHCGSIVEARKKNDLIERFDWLTIRRNEAYPVFTSASCDDVLPWPKLTVASGQINAFFRWRNIVDGEGSFAMELYIASPDELGTTQFEVPEAAIVDVSLRRIQSADIANSTSLRWKFGDMQGVIQRKLGDLITIENLPITRDRQILVVEPET